MVLNYIRHMKLLQCQQECVISDVLLYQYDCLNVMMFHGVGMGIMYMRNV